ncbi:hypothetical protein [Lutibaculum baratangense]|uniref:Outer membrane protein n=1 Tax=Lutibaculum baratangense AMV1 TaxID=631454 RepID=V4RWM5_9HYPH|nr:hypothetical protein [Lutibaculum baratangense]ESR27400.1 hypothetical protein N177_0094 [Lutibaculum baratangense AMV1]
MRRIATALGLPAFAAAVAVSLATPATAGAWTLPQGEGQAIITTTATTAVRQGIGLPDISKSELELLVEYGMTDDWTLLVKSQIQSLELGPPVSRERRGFGHTEIGVRRALWRSDRSILSIEARARPLGTRDENNLFSSEDLDPEVELRLLGGRSFTFVKRDAFVDLQLGYRAHFGGAPGEAVTDVTLGWRARPRLVVMLQSFNTFTDTSAARPYDDARRHKLQISGVWEVWRGWSLQLGAVSTVAGERRAQEIGAIAAVWRRF